MSQNGHVGNSARVLNHNIYSAASIMNNSSASQSWTQQDAGGVAIHQHSSGTGITSTGTEYPIEAAPGSPRSSSQSGTTLKEHDLLGLSSEVSSSSTTVSSKKSFHDDGELNLNLNLGSTELRLGPQKETGFQFPRGVVLEQQQETGNFLGGLDVGIGGEERRLSNVEQNVGFTSLVANERVTPVTPEKTVDRGFYSSLTGERVGAQSQTGRGDGLEGSMSCRPLIDSDSLQKRHGGDRVVAGNEGLRLGMSPMQAPVKRLLELDMGEKAFLKPADRYYQEKPHVEDPSFYQERSWAERSQQQLQQPGSAQEDRSSADKAHSLMMSREHTAETPSEVKPDGFQSEKRSLPEGVTLTTLHPPEPRFSQDMNAPERSPRHEDFNPHQQQLWHYQAVMTSQIPVQNFHSVQQMAHSVHQNESARHPYNGPPLGGFPAPRMLQQLQIPLKPGVSGAKRPYEVISDARNFINNQHPQQPQQQQQSVSVVNGNVSSAQADGKQKGPAPMSHQQWGQKPAPPWQMLQHTGGSFGPFPSKVPSRNQPPLPALNMPAAEVVSGGDPAQKAWETHVKNLQEPPSASVTMSCSAENKPGTLQDCIPAADTASAPRTASPAAPPANAAVGWPPLRSFRKNVLAANPRPSPVETSSRPPSTPPPPQPTQAQAVASPASVASQPNSLLVKVNMDGVPFGRKVDLKIHSSYDKLSSALEEMFRNFVKGQQGSRDVTLPSDRRSFLRGPDYVLTYEDQDGDLMLVGDVPWTLFIETVNRLRIMKGSEAIGLGTRIAEKAANKAQANV